MMYTTTPFTADFSTLVMIVLNIIAAGIMPADVSMQYNTSQTQHGV